MSQWHTPANTPAPNTAILPPLPVAELTDVAELPVAAIVQPPSTPPSPVQPHPTHLTLSSPSRLRLQPNPPSLLPPTTQDGEGGGAGVFYTAVAFLGEWPPAPIGQAGGDWPNGSWGGVMWRRYWTISEHAATSGITVPPVASLLPPVAY